MCASRKRPPRATRFALRAAMTASRLAPPETANVTLLGCSVVGACSFGCVSASATRSCLTKNDAPRTLRRASLLFLPWTVPVLGHENWDSLGLKTLPGQSGADVETDQVDVGVARRLGRRQSQPGRRSRAGGGDRSRRSRHWLVPSIDTRRPPARRRWRACTSRAGSTGRRLNLADEQVGVAAVAQHCRRDGRWRRCLPSRPAWRRSSLALASKMKDARASKNRLKLRQPTGGSPASPWSRPGR